MVAHDSDLERWLAPLERWEPDPRITRIALYVLSKDTSRKGARAAAARLLERGADQGVRLELSQLAAATSLAGMKAELAGIAARLKLQPERVSSTPVAEVRAVVTARLSDARAQVARDASAAVAVVRERQARAEALAEAKRAKKRDQTRAFRAELAKQVPRIEAAAPSSSLPEAIERRIAERAGELWRFSGLDASDIRALVMSGRVSLDDAPNGQPSVAELLGFIGKWPQVRAHGWVRRPPGADARLEGLHLDGESTEELRRDFKVFCDGCEPDDFVCTKKRLYSWWD